jgi:deazaflavin-dependent oxidoreductase (nitroreductase family)
LSWIDRTTPLWRIGNRIEAWEQRRFGTSLMKIFNPADMFLLETTGRRTGKTRYAPLAYWRDDDGAYIVGGGAAGRSIEPDWARNLRANPSDAAVWIKRRRTPVVARELTGTERDLARDHAATIWKGVPRYERLSGRVIPYFRLSPA